MKKSKVFLISEKAKDTNKDKYEKYIAELEQEVEALKEQNRNLAQQVRSAVAEAKGAKEKFMLHLSQFLTQLYSSLGKTQNDILKQSVFLNDYLAKASEEKHDAMVLQMNEKLKQIEFEG